MKSEDYRDEIRKMVKNGFRRQFPGLSQSRVNEAARYIAKNIHARFYGANVDDVESPLWRTAEPAIEASTLLKQEEDVK